MVKHILGLSGEPDLIDELSRQQVINDRFNPQRVQQVQAESRADAPPPRSSVRLAFGSSRSMRAAMVACNVAGTLTSPTSAVDT